jgi:hypothetical protein
MAASVSLTVRHPDGEEKKYNFDYESEEKTHTIKTSSKKISCELSFDKVAKSGDSTEKVTRAHVSCYEKDRGIYFITTEVCSSLGTNGLLRAHEYDPKSKKIKANVITFECR